jgi:hypothetical protein
MGGIALQVVLVSRWAGAAPVETVLAGTFPQMPAAGAALEDTVSGASPSLPSAAAAVGAQLYGKFGGDRTRKDGPCATI